MPFISLNHNVPDGFIGMWRVEENEHFFRSRLSIFDNEASILSRISHPTKRLEWLSSRLCLKEILNIQHKVESLNHNTGKPYLSDHSYHISYSHSNNYSGAIASKSQNVSLDLEDITKKRNLKARFLFMNDNELDAFDQLRDNNVFFLIWSAKETLYKSYAKKGIAFKDNLYISIPDQPLELSGSVKGKIIKDDINLEYEIQYQFFENILLTYTYCPLVL